MSDCKLHMARLAYLNEEARVLKICSEAVVRITLLAVRRWAGLMLDVLSMQFYFSV